MHLIKALAAVSLTSGACAAVAAIPAGFDSATVVELPSTSTSKHKSHYYPCVPRPEAPWGCLDAVVPMDKAVDHDAHHEVAAETTVISTLVVTVVATPIVTVWVPGLPEKRQISESKSTTTSMTAVYVPTQVKLGETEYSIVTSHSTVTAPSGTTTVYQSRDSFVARPAQVGTSLSTKMASMNLSNVSGLAIAMSYTTAVVTATASNGALESLPPSRLTTLTNPINPDVTVVRDKSDSCCSTNTEVDTHSYLNISTFHASGMTSYLTAGTAASASSGYWSSGSFYSSGTGATVTSLTTDSSRSSSSSHKYTYPGAVTSDIVSGSSQAIMLDDYSVLTGMVAVMAACFAFALML